MPENPSRQTGKKNDPLPDGERKYRQLISEMHNGYALFEIIQIDQGRPYDYRFLEINSVFECMTGLKSESVVGHTVLDILPQTEPSWFDQYDKVALTGNSIHFEKYYLQLKQHFEVTVIRTSPNLLACLFTDITERKKVEEALRESELKYQNLFENVQETFFEVSIDGVLLDVSPSVEYLSKGQYTRQDLIGKPLFDLYADYTEREKYLEVLQQQGFVTEYEIRIKNFDGSILDCSISSKLQRDANGRPAKIIGSLIDITARKRAEDALEKRMISLAQPLDNSSITFDELFNLEDIQRLQDEFSDATGVASIITHPDGTPLTAPSNFCRLCSDVIRKTEIGRSNCFRSDALLGKGCLEGPTIQTCLSGGLWDAGAGITVGGRHIANWLIGQVRDEAQTEAKMRAYALEIGADEETVVEAFSEVPAMARLQFEKISRVLFTLANQLSTLAFQNVQQARFIDEHKQVEEALQLTRFSIEHASDAVFWTTPDAYIVDVNEAACRTLGYTRQELLQLSVADVDPHYEEDQWIKNLAEQKLRGSMKFESEHLTKDGRLIPVEIVSNHVQFGTEERICGFVRDISERKQAEAALLAERRYLTDIIDSLPDPTFIIDNDQRIVVWNRAIEEMTGVKREGLLGKGNYAYAVPFYGERRPILIDLLNISEKNMERAYSTVRRCDDKIYAETFIPTLNHGKGVYLWGVAAPLYDQSGLRIGAIEVIKDITELKRSEKTNIQLQEQLLQAQKIESVGRLAGGVAHDFNNMLGVILGHAELAQIQLDKTQPLHCHLEEIRKAAQRSADLTRQLLAFARKQTIAPQILSINETVEGMLGMLQRLIGEDIDLAWHPGKEGLMVKMDPSQIDQILVNLCVNARDAISDNGEITIETRITSIDEQYCARHANCLPGTYVTLSVSDNGRGMDAEIQSHLFEPFYTTKETGQGTGLGLATVYGIVQQNNGFINVYSEPGQGSTFRIYLPQCDGEKIERKASGNIQTSHGHETILLVEDEPMVLEMTIAMLESLGYTILPATTPKEALRLAREHEGNIHLLLTDVIMPEMNGRDLANQLVIICPEIKLLFMSGYTANAIAHHGVLDEGVQFIQKPFTLPDLAAKLRQMFN
jgi:PAS domain S-box-containing protein